MDVDDNERFVVHWANAQRIYMYAGKTKANLCTWLAIDPKAAVERAKPQAATKFLSHAGENISRKSRSRRSLKLSPS